MHELSSIMPNGYRVEIIDASTVRFFAPNNAPTILQADVIRHSVTSLDNEADFATEPNQQGKSMSGAPNRSTLANQNSSEAAIMRQEETCNQQSFHGHRQNMMIADKRSILAHYFAQPTESRRTTDHPVIDTMDEPELAHIELNKTAESYADRIEVRWVVRYDTIRIYILI